MCTFVSIRILSERPGLGLHAAELNLTQWRWLLVCLPFKYSFTISFELNNFAGKLAHASSLTWHGSQSEASIAKGSCKHHFGLLSVYFLLPTYLFPFQTEKENHVENCMAEVETLRVLPIFDVVGWVNVVGLR